MEQHPVPQHISSYEFRLVGNMTLKQFGLLAGPCLLALITYALPFPSFLKWPLIIFFVFLGVAMAFLPVEERPLHQWLIAFFKTIYSPTQFVWKKKPKEPEIFAATPSKTEPSPPDQARIIQYQQVSPVEKTPLEQQEESFLKKVINLFQLAKMPTVSQPTPRVEPIKQVVTPPLPPKKKVVEPQLQPKITPPLRKEPVPPPPLKPAPTKIRVEPRGKGPVTEAKLGRELPFPQAPQVPNLLVGMVFDRDNKIIEGAILEIRNSKGIPVRALKTNKLGQFRIATQLKNDIYEIEIEKEGYNFDMIKIEVKGKIILPLEIRAK